MSENYQRADTKGFWLAQSSIIQFRPKLLIHRALTVRATKKPGAPATHLDFISVNLDPQNEIPNNFDIIAYVENLARNPTDVSAKLEGPDARVDRETPYDIAFSKQAYVVIELDSAINWEFSRGSYGITSKSYDPEEDANVVFLDTGGTRYGPDSKIKVPDKLCRLAYFHAVSRRPQGDTKRSFNFHITFDWANTKHSMPCIFDPDIPSSGGSSFP